MWRWRTDETTPLSLQWLVQCQPDGFLLLPLVMVVVVVMVVVQLVPRSCSLLPCQVSFSLMPIQGSTERHDRQNQRASFEQGLVVRQFVPQCRTGTDIRCNVTRASES